MSKTEIDRIVELQVPTAAVCIDGVCEVPAVTRVVDALAAVTTAARADAR